MGTNSAGNDRRVALLREFEGSGLSMAEFCRRREVAYSTMMAWRRACRPCPQPGAFVEVEAVESGETLTDRSQGDLCAELVLAGGTVLRVYQIAPTGGRA